MMETRQINSNFNVDSRTVEGYAVCFESESKNIGWIEVIHRGAITEETIKQSDIFAKFNHDDEKILARSKFGNGSLLLEVTDDGVRYMFESPKTALGDELLEYLHRGDISQSSFCFSIDANDKSAEKWTKKGNTLYRDIYKIERLYDVSPVWNPAYEQTSCSARFEEVKATSIEIDNKMNIIRNEFEYL